MRVRFDVLARRSSGPQGIVLAAVSTVSVTEEFGGESLDNDVVDDDIDDDVDEDVNDKAKESVFSVSAALLLSLTVDALPQLI